MRTQEDKYIASQLNSLSSLPEGYQANISSKWEMIEMGMEQKKKRFPFYYILAAAACLLLIMGIAYLSTSNKKETRLVIDNSNKKEQNAPRQLLSNKEGLTIKPGMVKIERQQSAAPLQKNNAVKPILVANSIDTASFMQTVATQGAIAQEKPTETSIGKDSNNIVAATIVKKQKQQRYFQMDFGEGTPNDPVQKTASNKLFQFRFSSKSPADGIPSSAKIGLPKLVQPL